MGCSWFNTETNKRKTSINNKNTIKYVDKKSRYETKSPAKNLQISSCSIATLSHVCLFFSIIYFLGNLSSMIPLHRFCNHGNKQKYYHTYVRQH